MRCKKKIFILQAKKLMRLAGPLIISNLAFTLLGSADTFFMGRVGPVELGAVGVASTLFLAASVILRGTVGSAMILVSQAFGAGDKQKVKQHFQQFIALAIILAPIAIFLPTLFRMYFSLTKPDETVLVLALQYMTIRSIEIPFSLISKTISSFMLGVGNTKIPMGVSWITVVVNLILNYLLVFGKLGFPRLGLAGAAWGTVVAQVIEMTIYILIVLKVYNKEYGLTKDLELPTGKDVRKMITLGFPMGLADSIDICAFGILMTLISRLGTIELAASQIANQLNDLAFMPAFAIGTATGSLVGRSLGERNTEKAEKYTTLGIILGVGTMGLISLCYWLIPQIFILPFTPDPDVYKISKLLLRLMAFYQVFDVIYIVFRGALNGAGQTRFTGIATALCVLGIFVPISYLGVYKFGFGLWGAWSGPVVYVLTLVVLLASRYKMGEWKEPWEKESVPVKSKKQLSYEAS